MVESKVVRVGKKFMIVLPKDVRKKLDIREGNLLRVRVEGGKIILEPKRSDPFKVLEKVVGEEYDEVRDEKIAERWLYADSGH